MGYTLVNVLAAALIVTSTAVIISRGIRQAAISYSVQACVLVGMLIVLGITARAWQLILWGIIAFGTKVVLVPLIIWRAYQRMGYPDDSALQSRLRPAWLIVLVSIELLICYAAIGGIDLPTASEVHPAMAVALAHFFIGLTCIISQNNIIKQMFGYCLMENGAHVMLALLAPVAPHIVLIGIITDAVFVVLIVSILIVLIWNGLHTLDSRDLRHLKG